MSQLSQFRLKHTPHLFLVCLSILPALVLGALVLKYSVNVPAWDEWAIGATLVKAFEGQLTFNDLIAQHNESRYLFPRLIYIAFAYITKWNIRYVICFSVLLSCIISLNLFFLSLKTLANKAQVLFTLFLSNLLIFSTMQFESWHSGLMLPNYITIASITGCLALSYANLNILPKLLLCSVLSTVSTFSFANGILCWVVFPPVILLVHPFRSHKEKIWLTFGCLFGFLLTVVIYFYNYTKPGGHPGFLLALEQPLGALQYFFIFIGASLGYGELSASTTVGIILIFLFFLSLFYILTTRKNQVLVYQASGWTFLGIYAFLTSLITTSGRFGFGVEQALYTSRYTTHSIYLPIALIYLITIIINNLSQKYSKSKSILSGCVMLLLIVFTALHTLSYTYGYEHMLIFGQERLRNKACLLWINLIPEKCLTKYVNPALGYLSKTANDLNKLGFLQPGLIQTKKLQHIQGKPELEAGQYGYFEALEKSPNGDYVARGWAILPSKQEIAHAVLLAYEQSDGSAIAFAISEQRDERKDVVKFLKNSAYLRSGWEKSFPASRLPKGNTQVSAWSFDAETGQAFRLQGLHGIDAEP
jgi:hypothetical protein